MARGGAHTRAWHSWMALAILFADIATAASLPSITSTVVSLSLTPTSAAPTVTSTVTPATSSRTTHATQHSPSGIPPSGCLPNYDGKFHLGIQNVNSSSHTLDRSSLQSRDAQITITLRNGILTDQTGSRGYIAYDGEFSFPNVHTLYTVGFAVCQNHSLVLGSHAIWRSCPSTSGIGSYLYFANNNANCSNIYITADGINGAHPASLRTATSAAASATSASTGGKGSGNGSPTLGTGSIVGIVIGCVVGVLAIFAGFWLWCRRKATKNSVRLQEEAWCKGSEKTSHESTRPSGPELAADGTIHELYGDSREYELMTEQRCELDSRAAPSELAGLKPDHGDGW